MRTAPLAMLRATVAAVVLTVGYALPSAAADAPKQPMETFHEIVQKLIDAEKKDGAAMAALFVDDAVLLPPGGKGPIQGKEFVRSFFDDYAKQKMTNHTITPSVIMLGDVGGTMTEAGTWTGDVAARQDAQATHQEELHILQLALSSRASGSCGLSPGKPNPLPTGPR